MKPNLIVRLMLLLLITLPMAEALHSQNYPTTPIRCITGFAPGTGVDAVLRVVGVEMEKNLGQPIILNFKLGVVLPTKTLSDDFGVEPVGSSPEEQLRAFESETKFWAETVRVAGFKSQ